MDEQNMKNGWKSSSDYSLKWLCYCVGHLWKTGRRSRQIFLCSLGCWPHWCLGSICLVQCWCSVTVRNELSIAGSGQWHPQTSPPSLPPLIPELWAPPAQERGSVLWGSVAALNSVLRSTRVTPQAKKHQKNPKWAPNPGGGALRWWGKGQVCTWGSGSSV